MRFAQYVPSAAARLTAGTGVAAAVGLLATPVLTRIYTPDDYAALGVVVAVTAVGASFATGRFERAIPLQPLTEAGDRETAALARLALRIALGTTAVAATAALVMVLLGWNPWQQELGSWVVVIPLGVLVACTQQVMVALSLRRQQYRPLSGVPALQTTVMVVFQAGLGLLSPARWALVVPALLAPGVSALRLRLILPPLGRSAPLRSVAADHADFPRYDLPFSLLNALSLNLQILLASVLYPPEQVGWFALVLLVLGAPVAIVAASFGVVLNRELVDLTQPARMRLMRRTASFLAIVGVPGFALVGLAALNVGTLLGPEWQEAGSVALALLPLLYARFVASPLATALVVARRMRVLLIWQVATLAATLTAFLLAGVYEWDILTVSWSLSLLVTPMYLILIPLAFRGAWVGPPQQTSAHSD